MTTHSTFSPKPGIDIAYHRTEARSKTLPGVIFMHGFMSDMDGGKAVFLENQCRQRGQAFVRFDYTGHGKSSGAFIDGTIGSWADDALAVFDHLSVGPQIVIGSSMGGWIALLTALKRKDRMAGLIGIAAAPDFSEDIYHREFGEEERRHLETTGIIYRPTHGDPQPLTRQLFEDGKKHLLLDRPIDITCPVRLIHGKKDDVVPWQKAEQIKAKLLSQDAQIIYAPNGDHRMSTDEDLILIDKTLIELSHDYQLKMTAQDQA